ncbi:hypothetical protein BOX15_Mlig008104g1 [Macrostomum lignano]|uniref:Peroxisomal leader peptide-processing protease n=2 Tax=Macrostomum lignano TaxID=282301 RepID=A0A267EN77_9PLAT|nr:hypothetical protein BOX15_Mlig008104g1 [Macrostomum lignano]
MYFPCTLTCHGDCREHYGFMFNNNYLVIFANKKHSKHLQSIRQFHVKAINQPMLEVNPEILTVDLIFSKPLELPVTNVVLHIKLFFNHILCFELVKPLPNAYKSFPMVSTEGSSSFLGFSVKLLCAGSTTAAIESSVTCQPGPSCYLLAALSEAQLFTERRLANGAIALADAGAGTAAVLGAVIGVCAPTTGAELTWPALLPAGRLLALLGGRLLAKPSVQMVAADALWPRAAASRSGACLLELVDGSRWGAAIALTPRLLVTCAHLVVQADKPTEIYRVRPAQPSSADLGLSDPAWAWRRATLLWANRRTQPPVFDVAFVLLEPDEPDLPSVAYRLATDGKELLGQSVIAVGFPFQGLSQPGPPMLSRGRIVHEFGGRLPGDQCPIVALQTSCPVFNGFSGGPVTLEDGHSVAMTVGHLRLHSPDQNCHSVSLSVPIGLLQAAADRFAETQDPEFAFSSLSLPRSVHSVWIWHAANRLLERHNPTARAKL